MKRHDPHALYANTMRPASAAPVMSSPPKGTHEPAGRVLSGNGVSALRYASGAPETAPHWGEMREDVLMGGHHFHRFQNRFQKISHKNTGRIEVNCPVRPQVSTHFFVVLFPQSLCS